MLRRLSKRFERLETCVKEGQAGSTCKVSRRFELLEVAQKRIEVSITDTILKRESERSRIKYFIFCPRCGTENPPLSRVCGHCKCDLLQEETGKITAIPYLKRCRLCHAANQSERQVCWSCGKSFSSAEQDLENEENVITVNLDGKVYKSTDKDLPLEVSVLMRRIRRDGYSKRLISEWLKERQRDEEHKNKLLYQQTVYSQQERLRITGLYLGLALGILYVCVMLWNFIRVILGGQ